jgi:hypothetical protein
VWVVCREHFVLSITIGFLSFPFCRLWTPHEGGKFNLCLFKNINQFVSEVNKGFQFWNIYGFFKLKDSTLQFFSGPNKQNKQFCPDIKFFFVCFKCTRPSNLKCILVLKTLMFNLFGSLIRWLPSLQCSKPCKISFSIWSG